MGGGGGVVTHKAENHIHGTFICLQAAETLLVINKLNSIDRLVLLGERNH